MGSYLFLTSIMVYIKVIAILRNRIRKRMIFNISSRIFKIQEVPTFMLKTLAIAKKGIASEFMEYVYVFYPRSIQRQIRKKN